MSEEQNNQNDGDGQSTSQSSTSNSQVNNEQLAKLVAEQVDSQLKDIKDKLNKAYGARDEALKRIAEFEQKEKEAELARLKEEGKHKEAYELQLAEEKAARAALEKRNIELTRDLSVKDVLKAYPFRNDNAFEMAYREIVGALIQNESGDWVHKSGTDLKSYVDTFANSDENSFLFKPKTSSGGGSNPPKSGSNDTTKKSLFEMSQSDVLKMAAEGKLRRSR